MTRFRTAALAVCLSVLAFPVAARAETPSEDLVADAVQERLYQMLGGDASHIEVRMIGDRAFLLGVVENRETEELAEEVALSVAGVNDVSNKLTLRREPGPIDDTRNEFKDAALEARIKHILAAEIGRSALKIEIEAASGTVALRGRVGSPEAARLAIAKTRTIRGVKRVLNLLDDVSLTASY